MKYINKSSISLRWFAIGAVITVICVFAGIYITHVLTEEERRGNRGGPQDFQIRVIRNLLSSGKLSEVEAFNVIAKTGRRPPHSIYLLDRTGKVVDSQEGFMPDDADVKLEDATPISENYYLFFGRRGEGAPEKGQGPGREQGRPEMRHHRPGPPPMALVVGGIAIAVSIIVGIGLTFLFLSMFFRKKTHQAEEVINKLKLGDLKARFPTDKNKETSLLMVKFNEMADQIEGLVTELRRTESTRTKMLQELAHDLRTPVASMKNLQEMLLEKDHLLDQEKRKHVQGMAVKEVYYFERLVEDLLFLSGVNDPKYDVNFKKMQLSNVIEAEAEVFESDSIHIEMKAVDPGMIVGNDHLIHRLMKNAISNAMKFAKSSILITIERLEDKISVTVLDDGPGMRTEDMQEFGEKKFSRRFQEGKQDDISIGLGSVIMKRIMTLHEGDLTIKNGEKGGCELKFSFKARD